jgi:putative PIN family toxin of toxin-antitoxin system
MIPVQISSPCSFLIEDDFPRKGSIENKSIKIVLDTNVIISPIIFGGKPRQILKLVQENRITAIITPVLVAELLEILVKKFQFASSKIELVQELIKENFSIVYPAEVIHAVRDEDDNRVLEAAVKGSCECIVTGDKDLLSLKNFNNITILKPDHFLK